MKIEENVFEDLSEYFDSEVYFHQKYLSQHEREEARRIERGLQGCILPAEGLSGSIYTGEVPNNLLWNVRRYLINEADKDESPGSRKAEQLLEEVNKLSI